MKKIVIVAIAALFAVSAFSQSNKMPTNKKASSTKTKAPANNSAYGKNAVKKSKKNMDGQANRFQTPKHQDAVNGKNAKKAKGGNG